MDKFIRDGVWPSGVQLERRPHVIQGSPECSDHDPCDLADHALRFDAKYMRVHSVVWLVYRMRGILSRSCDSGPICFFRRRRALCLRDSLQFYLRKNFSSHNTKRYKKKCSSRKRSENKTRFNLESELRTEVQTGILPRHLWRGIRDFIK